MSATPKQMPAWKDERAQIVGALDALCFACESLVAKSTPHIGQNVAYMVDQAKSTVDSMRSEHPPVMPSDAFEDKIREQAHRWSRSGSAGKFSQARMEDMQYAFAAGARFALNHWVAPGPHSEELSKSAFAAKRCDVKCECSCLTKAEAELAALRKGLAFSIGADLERKSYIQSEADAVEVMAIINRHLAATTSPAEVTRSTDAERPILISDRPKVEDGLLYELDQLGMHHQGEAGQQTCREAIYNIRTLRRDLERTRT